MGCVDRTAFGLPTAVNVDPTRNHVCHHETTPFIAGPHLSVVLFVLASLSQTVAVRTKANNTQSGHECA